MGKVGGPSPHSVPILGYPAQDGVHPISKRMPHYLLLDVLHTYPATRLLHFYIVKANLSF